MFFSYCCLIHPLYLGESIIVYYSRRYLFVNFNVYFNFADFISTTEDYEKDFSTFERDQIGNVNLDTVATYLTLKYFIPYMANLAIVNDFDTDKKGYLNIDQFVNMMQLLNSVNISKSIIIVFQEYDTNEDGYIDVQELQRISMISNRRTTYSEALDIIEKAHMIGDQKLNFIEFSKWYKHYTCYSI